MVTHRRAYVVRGAGLTWHWLVPGERGNEKKARSARGKTCSKNCGVQLMYCGSLLIILVAVICLSDGVACRPERF